MSVKKLHSEDRKEPYNTLNRTNKTVEELSKNGQRGEKKHSNAKHPYKSGKKQQQSH